LKRPLKKEQMTERPPLTGNGIDGVVTELKQLLGNTVSVILVGSAARNARTEESDIDLLLIGTERPHAAKKFSGFHIQASSVTGFLENLRKGEDFESWCVRLGIPLFDGSGHWASIVASEEATQWPHWELKALHGTRRLLLAHSLLEMGDNSAAAEELVYTLGHIGRGLLLKSGIFPLSRPELAEQLRQIGYPHLATIHEKLRTTEASPSVLRQARNYSKKLLWQLDRKAYTACGEEQRRKKMKKRPAAST
jgi:predicted nucleotidyltransferase